jgi:hypothetical protein
VRRSRVRMVSATVAMVAVGALCGCGGTASNSDASAPTALQSLANAAALARAVPGSQSAATSAPSGAVSLRLTADAKDPHRFNGGRTATLTFKKANCGVGSGSQAIRSVSADLGPRGHVNLVLGTPGTGVHQLPDSTLLPSFDVSLAWIGGSTVRSGKLVIEKPLAVAGHVTARLAQSPGVSVAVRWTCRSSTSPKAP